MAASGSKATSLPSSDPRKLKGLRNVVATRVASGLAAWRLIVENSRFTAEPPQEASRANGGREEQAQYQSVSKKISD